MPKKSNSLTRHIPESYINISFQTRKQLIELANEKKTSMREICLRLGIKLSTAKSILRKYRKFGKIFRRKSEENTTNFSPSNQQNTNRLSDQSQLPDTEKIAQTIEKPINFQQNSFNSNKELDSMFQHYFWIQIPFCMPNFYFPF